MELGVKAKAVPDQHCAELIWQSLVQLMLPSPLFLSPPPPSQLLPGDLAPLGLIRIFLALWVMTFTFSPLLEECMSGGVISTFIYHLLVYMVPLQA